jgi:hypothetical protein
MPPADQNPDLQSAFSFLILIARFVILEACSFAAPLSQRGEVLGNHGRPHPANPNPTWKPHYDLHPGRDHHDHHQ